MYKEEKLFISTEKNLLYLDLKEAQLQLRKIPGIDISSPNTSKLAALENYLVFGVVDSIEFYLIELGKNPKGKSFALEDTKLIDLDAHSSGSDFLVLIESEEEKSRNTILYQIDNEAELEDKAQLLDIFETREDAESVNYIGASWYFLAEGKFYFLFFR